MGIWENIFFRTKMEASALMGHTKEINEQYYTYDITSIKDKQSVVQMVTKDIFATKNKLTNLLQGQKQSRVIKGNQNKCPLLSLKPL